MNKLKIAFKVLENVRDSLRLSSHIANRCRSKNIFVSDKPSIHTVSKLSAVRNGMIPFCLEYWNDLGPVRLSSKCEQVDLRIPYKKKKLTKMANVKRKQALILQIHALNCCILQLSAALCMELSYQLIFEGKRNC